MTTPHQRLRAVVAAFAEYDADTRIVIAPHPSDRFHTHLTHGDLRAILAELDKAAGPGQPTAPVGHAWLAASTMPLGHLFPDGASIKPACVDGFAAGSPSWTRSDLRPIRPGQALCGECLVESRHL